MSSAAAEVFRRAARLNTQDDRREGSVVRLGGGCDVMVTGDLHGYRNTLSGVVQGFPLDASPLRRLVLQEIIHGPVDRESRHDRSAELLLRAAELKVAYPRQVLFLLGNHDIAQVTGNEISRGGQPSCKTFAAGVTFAFPDAAQEVLEAIDEFLLSIPLAVRCPNGVLLSHSLPSPQAMNDECLAVLERSYKLEDLQRGRAAYEWTWGRGQTPEQVDELAEKLGVEFFVVGHRHVANGYEMLTPRAMTLASDHQRGCVLRFGTDAALSGESAAALVETIAALCTAV